MKVTAFIENDSHPSTAFSVTFVVTCRGRNICQIGCMSPYEADVKDWEKLANGEKITIRPHVHGNSFSEDQRLMISGKNNEIDFWIDGSAMHCFVTLDECRQAFEDVIARLKQE